MAPVLDPKLRQFPMNGSVCVSPFHEIPMSSHYKSMIFSGVTIKLVHDSWVVLMFSRQS